MVVSGGRAHEVFHREGVVGRSNRFEDDRFLTGHRHAPNAKTSGRLVMNFARFMLLVVMAIGLNASCAHVPTLLSEGPETGRLRTQYLNDHPNGPHNAQIARGEVAKGMDAMEVLASWGVPQKRLARPAKQREAWSYTSLDQYSGDYVVYELVFVDRVLEHWNIDRATAGAGVPAMNPIRRVDESLMLQSGTVPVNRGGVPRK
jgi:hypothetical protein